MFSKGDYNPTKTGKNSDEIGTMAYFRKITFQMLLILLEQFRISDYFRFSVGKKSEINLSRAKSENFIKVAEPKKFVNKVKEVQTTVSARK